MRTRPLLTFWLCWLLVAPAAFALSIPAPLARAIEEESWHIVLAESKVGSPLHTYAQWQLLLDLEAPAETTDLIRFIDQHPGWPKLNRLRIRVEKALFQSGDTSAAARNWLKRYEPISGYGKLALARFEPNRDLVQDAWIHGDFERSDALRIRGEFRTSLSANVHRQRAERLLREGKTGPARDLEDDVGSDYAKLIRARAALQKRERRPDSKIAAVPKSLRGDHGLLADRARWRQRKGLKSGTRELLLQMAPDSPYGDALWPIRAAYARDAIEAKQYSEAARLLASAGDQLSGTARADALWLRGWLDYEFRGKARDAYKTFNKLYESVSYPVSRARGAFWAARAAEANSNQDIARGWYERAAAYPTAFYGQLAQAVISLDAPLALPPDPAPSRPAKARYESHPLMQLAIALHQADLPSEAMALLHHFGAQAETPGEFAAMIAIAREAKMPHAQVRLAKLALRKNIIIRSGWPKPTLPKGAPLAAEFAFAITRQESEFNARAISRANARGLMQLLPSTARKVAKKIEEPYALEKLFEPAFNLRLGTQYLQDLIDGFDGNHILAIAGYNAGPGRSRQWVERFGWPGKNLKQTLRFLELIPFAETRNYVQRVMEHAQTYRAIMNPRAPLQLKQDLLR